MRPPGSLKPKDFKLLTDEELHDVRVEGTVGSNYWEWANAEQERRKILRQIEPPKPKVADRPHSITIVQGVVMALIAVVALVIGFRREIREGLSSNGKEAIEPRAGRKELGILLADGIKITDECGFVPAKPSMPPDLAARARKWHDDVLRTLATEVSGDYVKQWRDAVVWTDPDTSTTNGAQCALIRIKTDALRNIITQAFK